MNSTLASLVADVYTLTNRPDLVGETTLAVRNATLKAHNSDFFYKDLFETGVVFDYPLCQQSLEYKTLVPRWRALKYLRSYSPGQNSNDGVAGDLLTVVTPDDILDSYSSTKSNVCYVTGTQVQIRTNAASQYFLLGCYIHPDVTPDNYTSWIAAEQPSAIIYEAAATVFKLIGYDEQNAAYKDLVLAEYSELKQSNIVAVGY